MTVAAHLKSATEALHRQTEALMPTTELLDGTMSLESYGALILRLYRIHSKLEGGLEIALKSHPQLSDYFFPKLFWLRQDLAALDLPPPGPIAPIEFGHTETAGRLAGMLYVMEGSTLGGQVILKGLKKNPNLSSLPHIYYTGYGPMTGPKWKAFQQILEEEVKPGELEDAVEGAKFAFEAFR